MSKLWSWGWNGDVCAVWGICTVFGDRAEKEKRATLIAAAPELLAALKKLVDKDLAYFDGQVMNSCISMRDVDLARAAIIKAEGK